MKRETITILYGMLVCLMVLALGIAYAQVVTELKIEGNTVGQEQEGVYITEVEYLTNSGADITNSKVNFFKGTMLDSNIILGSSTSSTITYQVTIKNNTDREQVFIGIIKDETNEEAYNNTNIQPNVETAEGITGLEEYVTTIAPGEYITFPVTYAYAGTDTSNPELQGKINFRFREKPILELSNEGEPYTLENIGAGHEEEYEFTVSNYNETYTNGVPLTYTFETTLTEGSPLTAIIYDSEGNEVTENITMLGDGTNADHTYTLKLIWDSSLDSTEYEGQSYTCTVKLRAVPDTTVDEDLADYAEYSIEKEFEINITTCSHTYGDWEITTPATCIATGTKTRTCSQCGKVETEEITIDTENGHNYVNKECTLCGDNINTAPVIATNSLSTKATTSITINVKATDADGDTLTYKLYTSTSQTGTYTLKQTSSATAQNTQITLTASSLSNYTTYWWYITVTDGTETTTSSKQSTKTYCPGTGYTCTATLCTLNETTSDCPSCDDGWVYTWCEFTSPYSYPGGTLIDEQSYYETCPDCSNETLFRYTYRFSCNLCGYDEIFLGGWGCNDCETGRG